MGSTAVAAIARAARPSRRARLVGGPTNARPIAKGIPCRLRPRIAIVLTHGLDGDGPRGNVASRMPVAACGVPANAPFKDGSRNRALRSAVRAGQFHVHSQDVSTVARDASQVAQLRCRTHSRVVLLRIGVRSGDVRVAAPRLPQEVGCCAALAARTGRVQPVARVVELERGPRLRGALDDPLDAAKRVAGGHERARHNREHDLGLALGVRSYGVASRLRPAARSTLPVWNVLHSPDGPIAAVAWRSAGLAHSPVVRVLREAARLSDLPVVVGEPRRRLVGDVEHRLAPSRCRL